MQSTAPSSEWDDDAVIVLAQLQGWNIMRLADTWYFTRPIPGAEHGAETRYAANKQEALKALANP
jgi:hypothetical protein